MFKRRKKDTSAMPGPGAGMRAMALSADPEALGLEPHETAAVWGVIMDTVMMDGAWHCLVALADGTTSLYTSSAFGVIGAGEHLPVRRANDGLLRAAESGLALLVPSTSVELPNPGHVTIRALTIDGHVVVTAPESDLGEGRHPASNLFHAAHEVITQLRLVTPR